MGLRATLPNYIPACRSEFLFYSRVHGIQFDQLTHGLNTKISFEVYELSPEIIPKMCPKLVFQNKPVIHFGQYLVAWCLQNFNTYFCVERIRAIFMSISSQENISIFFIFESQCFYMDTIPPHQSHLTRTNHSSYGTGPQTCKQWWILGAYLPEFI